MLRAKWSQYHFDLIKKAEMSTGKFQTPATTEQSIRHSQVYKIYKRGTITSLVVWSSLASLSSEQNGKAVSDFTPEHDVGTTDIHVGFIAGPCYNSI